MNRDSEEAEQEFFDRWHTILDDVMERHTNFNGAINLKLAHTKHSQKRNHEEISESVNWCYEWKLMTFLDLCVWLID